MFYIEKLSQFFFMKTKTKTHTQSKHGHYLNKFHFGRDPLYDLDQ